MRSTLTTAVVTGASRGIGAAIARRLGRDGLNVVVNHTRNEAEAAEVVRDIKAECGRAMAVRADVADPAAVRALFDAAEAAFGPVDVLVNNAGISRTCPLVEADDEHFRSQLETNLTGTFNGLREGARRVRDGGRIVSLSSSIVGTNLPAHGVYAATKAAVETLTRVLAKELGPRAITVNAVAPGPVATDLLRNGRSEELLNRLAQESPLGRLGEPEDIAQVVSFLAGPDGGWTNGQVLRVNGGRN